MSLNVKLLRQAFNFFFVSLSIYIRSHTKRMRRSFDWMHCEVSQITTEAREGKRKSNERMTLIRIVRESVVASRCH